MLYNINFVYTLARVEKKLYLCPLFVGWSMPNKMVNVEYKQ